MRYLLKAFDTIHIVIESEECRIVRQHDGSYRSEYMFAGEFTVRPMQDAQETRQWLDDIQDAIYRGRERLVRQDVRQIRQLKAVTHASM